MLAVVEVKAGFSDKERSVGEGNEDAGRYTSGHQTRTILQQAVRPKKKENTH